MVNRARRPVNENDNSSYSSGNDREADESIVSSGVPKMCPVEFGELNKDLFQMASLFNWRDKYNSKELRFLLI